ncbi:hypothetical protein CIL05_06490 [Virgibacillus profundi]|uniref:DAGKc domain-containing protein n=1 Tax=Virgibacillus profundi TaxID=2024555 RepID=A0A2A2IFH0_9BACI|nr:diacylglycerol kinase family protein [Virgibacillus profundi]PAV30108.1 hypothetical protein CIL05_06490 [Virgibacillus profundi]PXY54280.1 diacylglycerol kinase family lipid kinase [Virgibacillus profundi]
MYIFIVNPSAGNGRARRVFSKLAKSSLYKEIDSTYYYTEYNGHAELLAKQIKENLYKQVTAIIVIGGDGTLHEVINGLENDEIPVSFIPGGSGNDFARGIGMKHKPLDILRDIVTGKKEKSYWLGNYKLDNNAGRIFVNNMGFGFDAEIAKTANESSYKILFNKLHLGTVSYIIALIQVLFKFKPREIKMEINKQKLTIPECWMITISNHPYYGGGMKIIPDAKIQPTRFPVLIIHGISKWKVLALFMTVFTGKHINFKEVKLYEASEVKIFSNEEMYYQVDGQTDTFESVVIRKSSKAIKMMGIEYNKNAGA